MKYEVNEEVSRYLKRTGYTMVDDGGGNRRKTNRYEYVATGNFYGVVFDGGEILAKVPPNSDRELVERRTKAVFDALVQLEAIA